MRKGIVRLLTLISSTSLINIIAFALPFDAPPTNMNTMHPHVRELTLQCSDGMVIAAQQWYAKANPLEDREGETRTRNILCLHGWLDNCRSFSRLGPELAERLARTDTDGIDITNTDVNLVAIDFLGHGLSSHKSLDGPSILLSESAFYVSEAIEKLGWWKEDKSNKRKKLADGTAAATTTSSFNNVPFTLIGHSMGASVACVMAAAFPERIASLILLDGAGPLDRPAASIAKHVRNHIERRQAGNAKLVMESRVIYPSIDVAVRLRRKTATNFPGNQYLSGEAAKEMILRGSVIDDEGRVKFLHDPRLRWPSAHYFTAEQTESLYRDIQCPTCLLRAQEGWPVEEGKGERLMQILKPKVMKILPGSHHFHADPLTYRAVAEEIVKFLQE
jgi:pimeloyl-ACP methyl ester carboxylesterase